MAIGFSPKYIDDLKITDLSEKQALLVAIETAKRLDWNIGPISKNGLIAYTKFSMSSWSEEVQIRIENGNINLVSRCTGTQIIDWGKNRKNTTAFINTFNTIKINYNSEEIASSFAELEKSFATEDEDTTNTSPLNRKEETSEFLSLFKPTEGYFITPILLYINSIIFIIMVINGVHLVEPDSESLLLWGANFRPVTLDGEWWRLLSSCFLHIGIFHLLMNMYALLYIGVILEPYLGKVRFMSAYLISGIAGSVTSLYWNELTISAGASGAIFGMYGVFLALLTTSLIEKSARKALLTSIAVFVGYNLLNGMKGGIDNAAHIGGLISGLLVGYAYYPSLIKPTISKLKVGTIGLLSFLTIAAAFIVLTTTNPSDIGKYEKEMQQFVLLEEKALGIFNMPESTTDQEYLDAIKNTALPSWNKNLKLLERVEQFELPKAIHERNVKLRAYCDLRIKSNELLSKAISEGSMETYQSELETLNLEIESIINELSGQ